MAYFHNVKENAYGRKDRVREFIQDTFHPVSPCILSVKAPDSGASIHFSTTQLTASDGDLQGGRYYGRFGETNEWRYYVSPTKGKVN